eukprot:3693713-Heterocapsa_arctica.AAC.1
MSPRAPRRHGGVGDEEAAERHGPHDLTEDSISGLAAFQQYRCSTFGLQRPSSRALAVKIGLATTF